MIGAVGFLSFRPGQHPGVFTQAAGWDTPLACKGLS